MGKWAFRGIGKSICCLLALTLVFSLIGLTSIQAASATEPWTTSDFIVGKNEEETANEVGTVGDDNAAQEPLKQDVEASAGMALLSNTISPFAGSFSDVGYAQTPPSSAQGINISDSFGFVGYTGYDSDYPNVAVVSDDSQRKYGAMWSGEKLNLTGSFRTEMSLYMAPKTTALSRPQSQWGDGMTFTLHNDSKGMNALGSDGEGLGVYGSNYHDSSNPKSVIANAMSVEFDLYRNLDRYSVDYPDPTAWTDHFMWDPQSVADTQGHCSILFPKAPLGNTRVKPEDHFNTFYFPKTATWVDFSVSWEPFYTGSILGGTLTYTYAGETRSYAVTDANAVFGGTSVWWGFTGATGDHYSILAAAVTEWPEQAPIKTAVDGNGVPVTNVAVGDEFTYEITYQNYDENTTTIIVKDELPSGVDFLSASEGGQYDEVSRTVTWTIPNVESAGKGMVSAKVKVNESAIVKIENDASLQVGSNDPIFSGVVEVVVDPREPVKTVTKESGVPASTTSPGDLLTYTIAYENHHEDAADITIIDELPQEVTFVSATNGGIYNGATHTVTWELAGVPSATLGSVSVVVSVNEIVDGTVIENDGTVQIGNDTPRISNTVQTTVVPEEQKMVDVGDGTAVRPGDILTYTLSYVNETTATQQVSFTDEVPSQTTFVSATEGGSFDGTTGIVSWDPFAVASGERVRVSFTVIVNESASEEVVNTGTIIVDGEPGVSTNQVTNPVAPAPVEPAPVAPAPVEPVEPAPVAPAPVEPVSLVGPSFFGSGLPLTGDMLWIVPLLFLSVLLSLISVGRRTMQKKKVMFIEDPDS